MDEFFLQVKILCYIGMQYIAIIDLGDHILLTKDAEKNLLKLPHVVANGYGTGFMGVIQACIKADNNGYQIIL